MSRFIKIGSYTFLRNDIVGCSKSISPYHKKPVLIVNHAYHDYNHIGGRFPSYTSETIHFPDESSRDNCYGKLIHIVRANTEEL